MTAQRGHDGRGRAPGAGGGRWPAARLRRELRALAPLVALNGFAIAQPVLDVLGDNPELIVFRGARALDIWLLGLALVAAVPLVLWATEAAVGAVSAAARTAVHHAFVAFLGAALGAQLAARLVGLKGALVVLGAVVVGAAVTVALRASAVRLWFAYAALAPFAFLVLFLGFSPTGDLLRQPAATVQGVAVENPARVILLVLDELPLTSLVGPDGAIDAGLYPAFAELAGTSHWFRNTTSVASPTSMAVPSILTGRMPQAGLRANVGDHPVNLFTLLGGAYRMDVAESITRLCPVALCGTAEGSRRAVLTALGTDATRMWAEQVGLRPASDPFAGFAEPARPRGPDDEPFADLGLDQPERFDDLLRAVGETPTRTLHYVHLMLPHTPSRYLPSGRRYEPPAGERGGLWDDMGRFVDVWTDHPWPPLLGRQRAVLQTQYVDRLLGALMDELRRQDVWDETLLVVTSDHGRAFEPGLPARALDADLDPTPVLPDVMAIPFFLKEPGQTEGTVSDANVELTDVLPTIADVLGVALPGPVEGTSALGERPRPATKRFFQFVTGGDLGLELGEVHVVDEGAVLPTVLERNVHTLAPPDGDLRLYRVGPGADLVGRRVDELAQGPPAGRAVTPHAPDAFADVDPDAAVLPVLVSGRVEGPAGPYVAIAVNGVIGAVSGTFDWEYTVFAGMVPEQLLRPGANRLDLYLLEDPAAPVLRPTSPA